MHKSIFSEKRAVRAPAFAHVGVFCNSLCNKKELLNPLFTETEALILSVFYMPVIRFHRSPKSLASSSKPVALASRSPSPFT